MLGVDLLVSIRPLGCRGLIPVPTRLQRASTLMPKACDISSPVRVVTVAFLTRISEPNACQKNEPGFFSVSLICFTLFWVAVRELKLRYHGGTIMGIHNKIGFPQYSNSN